MKIGFLLQSFPVLSETFIVNQITGLMELGCDIQIVAFKKASYEKLHSDIDQFDLTAKTTWLTIPKSKTARRLKAAAHLALTGIRHPQSVFRLMKHLMMAPSPSFYHELFLGLVWIQEGFDIIHCHYGTVGKKAIFLKEIGFPVRISTAFHGYDLSLYFNCHPINDYNRLFEKGDLFFPVSRYWKDRLIELGCPEHKIVVHHMGIDLDKFEYRRHNYAGDKPFTCLTVGRLVEKKGHIYLLEALAELIRQKYQIRYEIAGEGPMRPILEDIVTRLNLESHVVFHGPVNREEIRSLFERADCFVLPSTTSQKGDMEGIPVVLMEAMAVGLPVISTYHSGIPELIDNDRTGILIPEKDTSALIGKLKLLMTQYGRYSSLSVEARQTIVCRFNLDRLNKELKTLLNCS